MSSKTTYHQNNTQSDFTPEEFNELKLEFETKYRHLKELGAIFCVSTDLESTENNAISSSEEVQAEAKISLEGIEEQQPVDGYIEDIRGLDVNLQRFEHSNSESIDKNQLSIQQESTQSYESDSSSTGSDSIRGTAKNIGSNIWWFSKRLLSEVILSAVKDDYIEDIRGFDVNLQRFEHSNSESIDRNQLSIPQESTQSYESDSSSNGSDGIRGTAKNIGSNIWWFSKGLVSKVILGVRVGSWWLLETGLELFKLLPMWIQIPIVMSLVTVSTAVALKNKVKQKLSEKWDNLIKPINTKLEQCKQIATQAKKIADNAEALLVKTSALPNHIKSYYCSLKEISYDEAVDLIKRNENNTLAKYLKYRKQIFKEKQIVEIQDDANQDPALIQSKSDNNQSVSQPINNTRLLKRSDGSQEEIQIEWLDNEDYISLIEEAIKASNFDVVKMLLPKAKSILPELTLPDISNIFVASSKKVPFKGANVQHNKTLLGIALRKLYESRTQQSDIQISLEQMQKLKLNDIGKVEVNYEQLSNGRSAKIIVNNGKDTEYSIEILFNTNNTSSSSLDNLNNDAENNNLSIITTDHKSEQNIEAFKEFLGHSIKQYNAAFDTVKLLLDNGVDPNEIENYQTHELPSNSPLIYAQGLDDVRLIKELLDKGADPKKPDTKGNIPLLSFCTTYSDESAKPKSILQLLMLKCDEDSVHSIINQQNEMPKIAAQLLIKLRSDSSDDQPKCDILQDVNDIQQIDVPKLNNILPMKEMVANMGINNVNIILNADECIKTLVQIFYNDNSILFPKRDIQYNFELCKKKLLEIVNNSPKLMSFLNDISGDNSQQNQLENTSPFLISCASNDEGHNLAAISPQNKLYYSPQFIQCFFQLIKIENPVAFNSWYNSINSLICTQEGGAITITTPDNTPALLGILQEVTQIKNNPILLLKSKEDLNQLIVQERKVTLEELQIARKYWKHSQALVELKRLYHTDPKLLLNNTPFWILDVFTNAFLLSKIIDYNTILDQGSQYVKEHLLRIDLKEKLLLQYPQGENKYSDIFNQFGMSTAIEKFKTLFSRTSQTLQQFSSDEQGEEEIEIGNEGSESQTSLNFAELLKNYTPINSSREDELLIQKDPPNNSQTKLDNLFTMSPTAAKLDTIINDKGKKDLDSNSHKEAGQNLSTTAQVIKGWGHLPFSNHGICRQTNGFQATFQGLSLQQKTQLQLLDNKFSANKKVGNHDTFENYRGGDTVHQEPVHQEPFKNNPEAQIAGNNVSIIDDPFMMLNYNS
ncbi:MAG: hypothetical protein H6909_01140 [Rickettsiaceae bacterium]|nr:hypothetical protein [Rickettsiaceae bacterium]